MQCRSSRDKHELLRIVRAPDGTLHVDETGRANGRGAYLCRDESCVEGAITKGTLGRSLGTTVPMSIADELRRIVSRGTFDGAQ